MGRCAKVIVTCRWIIPALTSTLLLAACSVLETTSRHEFESGYYRYRTPEKNYIPVYLDINEDTISVYKRVNKQVQTVPIAVLPLGDANLLLQTQQRFKKQSLDIDLMSVVFKYHPARNGFPAQLTTELNAALYAGWRFDTYTLKSHTDPIGRRRLRSAARGMDAGLFVGAGSAGISPFNTNDMAATEYNALALQYGIAGFLESSFASFGIAIGWDQVTGPHRRYWQYQGKPWIGFVVGIALQ